MSPDLRELYQSVILDHNKHPRNFCKPKCSNRTAEGVNELGREHNLLPPIGAAIRGLSRIGVGDVVRNDLHANALGGQSGSTHIDSG